MINEKNKIIKAKIKLNEFQNSSKFLELSDNLNTLFCDIISKSFDNLWWQSIILILQYLFLIICGLNENVSLIIYYNKVLYYSLIQL